MATTQISEAQLEANRANAQLSTGPTSLEGKSISSRNATRHGFTGQVLPRDAAERRAYAEKAKSVIATWKPIGDQEEQLVELIHDSNWQMKRIRAAQEAIIAGDEPETSPENLMRYLTKHTGVYFRSIAMLIKIQAIRKKAEMLKKENAFELKHQKVYNRKTCGIMPPPDGFVLQESPVYQYFDRLLSPEAAI